MTLTEIAVFGLVSGLVGTSVGGLSAFFVPAGNKRFISFVLEFSAGLMLAVVCFDLLPHAFQYAGLVTVLPGLLAGAAAMIAAQRLTEGARGSGGIRGAGFAIAFGVALHNLPEGLAIGSGFEASFSLGVALTLAIMLHDVPEGISVAVPLLAGGLKRRTAFLFTVLSGLPMGVGALIGALAGQVSRAFISVCLSVAGGAMLYVVIGEMIPQSKRLYLGRFGSLGAIAGFVVGLVIARLLE